MHSSPNLGWNRRNFGENAMSWLRNMIYIGDGLTDVPCMKLVKVNGGYSIAVHQGNKSIAERLMRHGRVDFIAPANYSKSSKMENLVFTILEQIAATSKTVKMHLEDMDEMDEVNAGDELNDRKLIR